MQFTNQEIVFLISVSRGRVPFGITTRLPEEEEEKLFIEETIEVLKEKKILDQEAKLTKEGADIISFFELYRNNERHISLNQLCAAITPEGRLITAVPLEDGYDIRITMPEVLMLGVLKNHEYLCGAEEKDKRGKWQDLDVGMWQKEIDRMDSSILLREYTNGRRISERIYCWKGEEGYLLNLTRGRMRSLSAGAMRKQIYETIGGRKNGGEDNEM